jgi:hypothetical protein
MMIICGLMGGIGFLILFFSVKSKKDKRAFLVVSIGNFLMAIIGLVQFLFLQP